MPDVKIVTIRYGVLGNPNNAAIQKAMKKWLSKGYELKNREEAPKGCLNFGTTNLTFIKPD